VSFFVGARAREARDRSTEALSGTRLRQRASLNGMISASRLLNDSKLEVISVARDAEKKTAAEHLELVSGILRRVVTFHIVRGHVTHSNLDQTRDATFVVPSGSNSAECIYTLSGPNIGVVGLGYSNTVRVNGRKRTEHQPREARARPAIAKALDQIYSASGNLRLIAQNLIPTCSRYIRSSVSQVCSEHVLSPEPRRLTPTSPAAKSYVEPLGFQYFTASYWCCSVSSWQHHSGSSSNDQIPR
jgi:hypothetical protein